MNIGDTCIVAGVMTGTSLDGIDVVVARIHGSGSDVRMEQLHFQTHSFEDEFRERLERATKPEAGARELARLDIELGHVLAHSVRATLESGDIPLEEVDVVGSHGQTTFHEPATGTTVQIGDPSVIAQHLGVTVVGDFRRADMAQGGQGAPLVPYYDWCLFRDSREYRVLLNLGGIANVTMLPPNVAQKDVIAFDTGPSNLVIDAVMERLFGREMDEGGTVALSANPDPALLENLLEEPYFSKPPPKSTGREVFDGRYADKLIREGRRRGLSNEVMAATATALTVRTVSDAISRIGSPTRIIASGGGVHNSAIMQGLSHIMKPVVVESIQEYGVDPNAKEALCFALLAVETMRGVPCGMPSVTGAFRSAVLGKICKAG